MLSILDIKPTELPTGERFIGELAKDAVATKGKPSGSLPGSVDLSKALENIGKKMEEDKTDYEYVLTILVDSKTKYNEECINKLK